MSEIEVLMRTPVQKGHIVLAKIPGCQPFVTWYERQESDYHWGHYFTDIKLAKKDFKLRIKGNS